MIRLAISVEGETEEQFVNLVLIPHLVPMDILPTPILLGRARNTSSGGGNVSLERLGTDMAECYHNYDFVTSLVDFYGFRRRESRTVEELEQQILQEVGRKLRRDLDVRKVIPYIQMYEFEGLLFSDVEAFGKALGLPEQSFTQLANVRSYFETPEDINDGPNTAPSKRIAQVIAEYNKVTDGLLIAQQIGLSAIRAQCPRFNAWLATLESLSE